MQFRFGFCVRFDSRRVSIYFSVWSNGYLNCLNRHHEILFESKCQLFDTKQAIGTNVRGLCRHFDHIFEQQEQEQHFDIDASIVVYKLVAADLLLLEDMIKMCKQN